MANRPARDYFPALTGLRGIAAVWVMLLHLWSLAGGGRIRVLGLDFTTVFTSGFLGVDLFFVLSGFLLALPFLRWVRSEAPYPRLGRFYRRRALRVLPAYYAQLLILICVPWLVHGSSPVNLAQFLAYLSMEFTMIPLVGPLLHGVWWSLPVEWNFYLLLPLLGLVFRRLRWWLVGALVLLLVLAVRVWLYQLVAQTPEIGLRLYPLIIQLPGRLDEFVFGMIAAWFHLRRQGAPGWPDRLALLAGIGGITLLLFLLRHDLDIFGTIAAPQIFYFASLAGASFACIIYASSSTLPLVHRLFSGRILAFLGTVSYSLYLWHGVLFGLTITIGLQPWALRHGAAAVVLLLTTASAVAIFVAWLSYRLTERPFLVTAPAAQRRGGES